MLKRLTTSVVSVSGAFVIGILDLFSLLTCSFGPYIAILALFSRTTTRIQEMLYLLLYSRVFILPLLVLALGYRRGSGGEVAGTAGEEAPSRLRNGDADFGDRDDRCPSAWLRFT